jgi:SAM-dependent methyltransferase
VLSPLSAKYARALSGGDPGFVVEIDPADEMYAFGLDSLRGSPDAAALLYFSVGRLIADSISSVFAWRFGDRRPRRTLDFAAGFGRVTRFLARRLAPETITVAEIDPAALEFHRRAFGIDTMLSPPDAASFRPDREYDAVVASSFFSHLSEDRFEPWLARLWSAVSPGGVMAFSTHGPALLPEGGDMARGIVFHATSETSRLDPAAYGTSWVTPEFVGEAVRRSCEGGALHAIPFGLDGRQDLYVIARDPDPPGLPLTILPVPRGDLDRLDIHGSERLTCEGRLDSESEAEVVFLARDEERDRIELASGQMPRKWRFEIDLAGISPDDVLRIEARRSGRVRILAMGTLRPFL